MTNALRRALCLALALPFVAALSVVGTSAAHATPDHYTPPAGPTFNNPYGGSQAAHRIVHELVRTIDSVHAGHKIRIATWNFKSHAISRALIRAHRRGVSVRVIMDRGNANPDNPNRIANRTQQALAKGNKKRPSDMTSFLRKCRGSCRGPSGISHVKFYLFDKVQKRRWVVMYGSNNATELSASIQWNDVYTIRDSQSTYNQFQGVFNQMRRDRAVKQGYLHYHHNGYDLSFYPYRGKGAVGDPVLNVLNKVRCSGATNGTGVNGHTKIRIAQTATYGDMGLAIAKRLATMKKRGCNIRLVYSMFGKQALQVLRNEAGATPVPMTHLAWDRNCDGIYDRYLHMKSMTIQGNYNGNSHATVTWNGSANWTPVALASDEVVGMIPRTGVTREYANWIDYLFTHRPASWGDNTCNVTSTTGDRNARTHVDPYALIKRDL
jgi:phosphatidylserine/phosphatidylglycerophosphate/cardiolipin synthase-like enzyme